MINCLATAQGPKEALIGGSFKVKAIVTPPQENNQVLDKVTLYASGTYYPCQIKPDTFTNITLKNEPKIFTFTVYPKLKGSLGISVHAFQSSIHCGRVDCIVEIIEK